MNCALTGLALAFATPATAQMTVGETVGMVDGVHYSVAGDAQAPPLILLHGLGADRTRYRYTFADFASTHRVVAIDFPGFGDSPLPDTPLSGRVLVDSVLDVMNALDIAQADVVGNSMGGWVSLQLALRAPERVRSLFLLDPAFMFGLPDDALAATVARGSAPKNLEGMRAYVGRVYGRAPESERQISTMLEKSLRGNRHTGVDAMAAFIKADGAIPEAELGSINVPALIVHGSKDGVVPADQFHRLDGLMPRSERREVGGIGHAMQEEAPIAFADLLRDFPDTQPPFRFSTVGDNP